MMLTARIPVPWDPLTPKRQIVSGVSLKGFIHLDEEEYVPTFIVRLPVKGRYYSLYSLERKQFVSCRRESVLRDDGKQYIRLLCRLVEWAGGRSAQTPTNGYVTEDGTIFYVAEDGTTFYVQES